MTFLRGRKMKVDARPAALRYCWLCSKPLGHSFTTVTKDGRTLDVHFPCRPEAAAIVSGAVIVEDQPDTFNLPIG